MSSISFDNVYLLLIAVPLVVLFTIPFVLAVRKDNRNGHNIASQVLHIVMAIVIALAAAGPSITSILTETDVYVVADVSYSAKHNLDTIDSYIKNLELPRNSKLGLVCFGKDYQLVSELGDPDKIVSVKNATVDDSETNIAEALTYTGTLFGTGVIKRIVLITDGKQTDAGNSNAIRRAVDGLETQSIKVDAIFLDDNPGEDDKEVQLSGVEFTETVYLDSEQMVRVSVQSSYETNATLTLRRNGLRVATKEESLAIGLTTVNFDLDTSQAGTFDYEVSVVAIGDPNERNNSYYFTQTVSDEMRMLVVTQSWDDCVAAIERYGNSAYVDVYESDYEVSKSVKNEFIARYENNDKINVYTDETVPFTLEALCIYDQILLTNIDICDRLAGYYTEFINNLDTAVSTYGKSLITMGNLHIQERDDDELLDLEMMLPVKYGNRDEDPKLYTLVIDSSRSMDHLYHLSIAKELAVNLVNVLNEKDYISVVKFHSDVEIVFEAEPLTNREKIIEEINKFEIVQGTVVGKGLRRAYENIKNLQYSDKQVMLITDGVTFGDDDDPIEVAAEMYADEIVTSVFDVGRQGDTADGDNVNASLRVVKKILQEVAKEGNGNYYYSNNVEDFDQVNFGEIANAVTEAVIEEDTTVNVNRRTDDVLAGIDVTKILDVSGYVYSGNKPDATTVLTVNHKRASGKTTEKPLYAYRKYGYGRVSTFTSSLGGDWIKYWKGAVGDTFFDNVLETSVPEEKNSNPYLVSVTREGKSSRVEVELGSLSYGATVSVEITLPDGKTVGGAMNFSAATYYYDFESADVGKYTLNITYNYNNKDYVTEKAVYVAYTDEYDAFAMYESSPLHRAIDGRGTVSEDGTLKIENNLDEVGRYTVEFAVPLLIVAVVLFIVDIIVRKLKWEDVASFFGFGSKKEVKK